MEQNSGLYGACGRSGLRRSVVILSLLTGIALFLAGAATQGSVALFTDQEAITGNTFTTAVCFTCETGFLSPTAQGADSGGDGDGYEGDPTLAFALDGNRADDRDSGTNTSTSCGDAGKDRHRFYDYGFVISAGSAIDGIEVRLDARVDQTGGSPFLCVEISWDGGTSWTGVKTTPTLDTVQLTYIVGSVSDTWGRTWDSSTEFTNASFRVRVTDVAADVSTRFRLDWIAVQVTYTP